MLDGIQPYLDEGEKIYVGKLDSLKAFTGKNRIKIEGKMMYGVNQVKCVISYKDPITLEEKFKEFPIERTEPRETFEFMLENLTEGQYDFSIVTYDPKNNTSIPTEVSAYAYGELYQQALTNRILHSISPEQKEIVKVVLAIIVGVAAVAACWQIARGLQNFRRGENKIQVTPNRADGTPYRRCRCRHPKWRPPTESFATTSACRCRNSGEKSLLGRYRHMPPEFCDRRG